MPEQPARPLPTPNVVTIPFWEAARRHELALQRCHTCDHIFFYPRELCPRCLSSELEWTPVSGKGHVYTYTIIRQAGHAFFQEQVPYIFGVVQLAEGPRMFTNFLCGIDDVYCGMPVEAEFEDISDRWTLVKFKPLVR